MKSLTSNTPSTDFVAANPPMNTASMNSVERASSPAPAELSPLRLPADSPPPPAPVREALVSKPKEGAAASMAASRLLWRRN